MVLSFIGIDREKLPKSYHLEEGEVVIRFLQVNLQKDHYHTDALHQPTTCENWCERLVKQNANTWSKTDPFILPPP